MPDFHAQATTDTIRIVHCSDLHFGSLNQTDAWSSFRNDVNVNAAPHLVLITGDIVHTTKQSLYKDAANELTHLSPTCPHKMCAGNHDRHPFGNAPGPLLNVWQRVSGWKGVPAWFDATFIGRIPTVENPSDLTLLQDQNKWTVRVIGIDTSANALYSAQGFASLPDIEGLKEAASHPGSDLVIVLHHHHLLSLAAVESARQKLGQLFRPTIMLNAGKVLEALAQSHVNMVLHGHEHHRAVSRYGTLTGEQTQTVVLGAGSATGNDSVDGCDVTRASYNMIELRKNKTVFVRERGHAEGKWSWKGSPIQLFDDRDIRRAKFYRRARNSEKAPTSKVAKAVEFRSDRTIDVHQSWTDWGLEDGRWNNVLMNSSGILSQASVTFEWLNEATETHSDLRYVPHSSADHSYSVVIGQAGAPKLARRVALSYRWSGGGLLTKEDLGFLDPARRGEFRRDSREFTSVTVKHELQSLSLLVRLPQAFAPGIADVEIHAAPPNEKYVQSTDLREKLQHHAPGLFSVEIPYPLPDYTYALTWPLSEAPQPSMAAKQFRDRARLDGKLGSRLLQVFAGTVSHHAAMRPATLGLYVPGRSAGSAEKLERAAQFNVGDIGDDYRAPESLPLTGGNVLQRNAWWGQLQIGVKEPGKDELVFQPGERAVAIVPLRLRQFGREDEVSWGLIRMGIHTTCGEDSRTLLDHLKRRETHDAFANGVLSVLETASR